MRVLVGSLLLSIVVGLRAPETIGSESIAPESIAQGAPAPGSAGPPASGSGARRVEQDPLDGLTSRLQSARLGFEGALAVPADALDVREASRRFDEELLDLHWELARLHERREVERPGSWRLLLESFEDELHLSWARLHDVACVTAQIQALARLDVDMTALLDAGRGREALHLFETKLPEPMDPLDWPAVVRRRLRDVEHLARAAQASLEPAETAAPETTARADAERGSRPR